MSANLSVKTFPSRADYIAAVEKAANFVLDPVLKRGCPRTDRNGQPLIFSGGFTLLIILNSPLRPRRDGGSAKPETTPSTVFPHDLPSRPTPEGISTRNNERKGGKIKVHRKQKGGRNRAYSD